MIRDNASRTLWLLVPALAVVLLLPGSVVAQGGDGFLFKRPLVTLKVETGFGLQFANSDIFEQSHEELTFSRKDLTAPYFGGEVSIRANEQVDIGISVGFSESTRLSEYRHYVDFDDLPIEQTTTLRLVPVALTGKYYFKERGREVGRFAWIPTGGVTPYVGAGVGFVSYEFSQVGDFIDFDDGDIVFYDDFRSGGETTLVRGLAGASLSLGEQFELTGEVRYSYASDTMSSDFRDFDALDLSGVQGVFGIALRF